MAAKFNVAGERVLSRQEFAQYVTHLYALPESLTALALQLQLTTAGQRLAQLLRLRRADVADNELTMIDPKGRRTKARNHVLPVVPEVREVLNAIFARIDKYDNKREHLFANPGGSLVMPESLSEVARNISTLMLERGESTQPFRLGDVRRTVETMLAGDLGVSKDVRAQLLSHGLSGVQDKHYDMHLQSVFGVMGGIGADPENVLLMKQTADRLFGKDYVWSLFAAGKQQMPFVTMGAVLGGNVRVGLEDSLFIERGKLAESSAQQVAKIRRILTELGMEIATPDEARQMLQLKGRANVAF